MDKMVLKKGFIGQLEDIVPYKTDPSLCSKCQSASVSVEGSRCSDCI